MRDEYSEDILVQLFATELSISTTGSITARRSVISQIFNTIVINTITILTWRVAIEGLLVSG